jgi:adsorption protein B
MFAWPDSLSSLLLALQHLEHELLLFAAFWFILGTIDELTVDIVWLWLRLTGRVRTRRLPEGFGSAELNGRVAVFVPAWHEAGVIGAMIGHMLHAWPQRRLRIYVGCYANDRETVEAALDAAGSDERVRIVVHGAHGPTTKADCLNRLYHAMAEDERRNAQPFTAVVLHDAEDMVHPAALELMDRALQHVNFVQLPVRPEPQRGSEWVAGHYSDEFTEAHAKSLVVRDAVGAAIPAAGVGCGFARDSLAELARRREDSRQPGPFAPDCLTEDYELGLLVSGAAGKGRFIRCRDSDGALVATRAYFPATLDESVRQKTRWIHGIALQGWDRLGWSRRPVDIWMALRDRRGPLTAVVLAAAYGLLVVEALLGLARVAGWHEPLAMSNALRLVLIATFAGFVWRATWRFAFTAFEYGVAEAIRSVLRIPIANVIAIMAGRRALAAYVRTLRGGQVTWDKTTHTEHPATASPGLSA